MKILIIDDETSVRRALRRAAEKRGHEIYEAEEGLHGVSLWQEVKPDLVFLDVLMPGLSGPDVLKELAGRNQAKVVLMSAFSADYDPLTVRQLGADQFVPKPFKNIFDVLSEAEDLVK